ncbi:hypothetical protein BTO05_04605 [Winogradskyella sp. PC-19]|uniref:glycosyltransferase family 4 protein n=1 Tax=unclassified Winogradskyella TaxID=2615021 RepID=UPI000B3C9AD4|nr:MULTISPECIES: glycosyltransferase family 4 protein [unclassified Winogradskyella]ARV08949.1 hypothetical protein BTO05_04605 [Winogradskyella sp. PC-19]
MSKKIGIVLSQTPGYSETFFISKIKGLQDAGADITLFVQHKNKDFDLCAVKVAKAKSKNLFIVLINLFSVFWLVISNFPRIKNFYQLEKNAHTSLLNILKKIYLNVHILSADLNWLHFGFATLALQKKHLAKAIGAKMGVSIRGFDICIYPVKHPGCYTLLWENVDKVHAISDDLILKLRAEGLPKHIPIEKITPAIDTDFFTVELTDFKKDNGFVNLISVSRLHWKKGFSYTLEALALLKSKGINFKYTIVGDGPLLEEVTYAIHQLDLTENIHLVGKKAKDDVINLYKKSHVFIQYSITEGFCNAALEAQSMGLLCIVSDAEGLPENIEHSKSGWVIPKRNPKALAEKIEEVIKLSDKKMFSIRSYAQQRVKLNFTIKKQQKQFVRFFNILSK